MQACDVTIVTTVDGRESSIVRKGELSLALPATLRYAEEDATVTVTFDRATATIVRTGDYGLSLRLVQGETTEGSLGLGGAAGAIQAQTTRVGYAVGENSLLATLRYALVFGTERQEMRLRISARITPQTTKTVFTEEA